MQRFEEPHATREPQFGHSWYRRWKHYILYRLENDNFKTAWI